MMGTKRTAAGAALALMLSGSALAHSGVKNEAVKTRMALMGEIKEATAVLGDMAAGKRAFDAARAAAARARLIESAGRIGAAFKAPARDPKSESRPEIWSDWPMFRAKAKATRVAAEAMAIGSIGGIRAGMGALGKSCGDCHKLFRIKK